MLRIPYVCDFDYVFKSSKANNCVQAYVQVFDLTSRTKLGEKVQEESVDQPRESVRRQQSRESFTPAPQRSGCIIYAANLRWTTRSNLAGLMWITCTIFRRNH